MLVCHFIRGDICNDLMHHLPSILFPPILDLPLSLKTAAFTSTRLPGFKFAVPVFLLYHFCRHASTTDWACASHRAVLNLPHMETMYSSIHLVEASLGGLVAANSGEGKVDWEPRPSSKHQIVWTVPSNCRSDGIMGGYYFSQMRWQVSFFVFSQLPDHAHNHLV